MALKWSKVLTESDAQQETNGSRMPFLRFTKQGLPHNHRTWFRQEFFADLAWKSGFSARGLPTETAAVKIRVVIQGDDFGVRTMRVDHRLSRAGNNSAPTTHLHYDDKTRLALESTDLAGHEVTVQLKSGNYSLEIL